ncbi:Hypothetical predicted protein [Cloeon dipterum]|uniref:Uncharacterized protein n=1 Tax=Cloeon dipterum TaxID=197152 RepID=A0A8S1C221_9INSE|nr:Hypothetical predicted protein [Cloeon dipterum]
MTSSIRGHGGRANCSAADRLSAQRVTHGSACLPDLPETNEHRHGTSEGRNSRARADHSLPGHHREPLKCNHVSPG